MTYDVSGALQQAVVKIDRYINHTGDGPIDQGKWSSIFPNTNVELYVQNHAKKKVTYGILGSVFSGLAEAAIDYKHKSAPILFQINDGKWGELGIGYVGILVNGQPGSCQYSVIAGQDFPCEQVVNGTAVGGLA